MTEKRTLTLQPYQPESRGYWYGYGPKTDDDNGSGGTYELQGLRIRDDQPVLLEVRYSAAYDGPVRFTARVLWYGPGAASITHENGHDYLDGARSIAGAVRKLNELFSTGGWAHLGYTVNAAKVNDRTAPWPGEY